MDDGVRTQDIGNVQVTPTPGPTAAMFRITRGHTIQHAPAFPNPALRFPDDTPLPIYRDDERPEESAAADQPTSEAASESPGSRGDAPVTAG